jgi:hypothetical protein
MLGLLNEAQRTACVQYSIKLSDQMAAMVNMRLLGRTAGVQ